MVTTKKIPKNIAITEPQARPALPPTPPQLLSQAIAANAPIETIERMMAMAERWEDRQKHEEFNAALRRIKERVGIIPKSGKASFGAGRASYRYETYADVWNGVTKIGAEEGISHGFEYETLNESQTKVTLILAHENGYERTSSLIAFSDTSGNKNPQQAIGSALTYTMRRLTMGAFGLAADVDDDAMASAGEPRISAEQATKLRESMEAQNYTSDMFCQKFSVASVELLPASRYDEALQRLENRRAKFEQQKKVTGNERTENAGVVSGASG